MEEWLTQQGYELSCTRLWAGDVLPAADSFSALIVMGGPMGIYDHDEYPWLVQEKAFLRQVVDNTIPTLGICLGAQLLADVLGAKVSANPEKEIGWFPVTANPEIPESLRPVLPEEMTVFHWHGDTFTLPENSVNLYHSKACRNQAFLYKEHVLGLQFHLETTKISATALVENCRAELVAAPWIMTENEIIGADSAFDRINGYMHKLLLNFF
jgi:GMP synthase (glutamine-hydrolysing)